MTKIKDSKLDLFNKTLLLDLKDYTTVERDATTGWEVAATIWNSTLALPQVYNGTTWDNVTLNAAIDDGGTTAQRPATPALYYKYYDTTIAKLIVWNGSEWVIIDDNNVGGTTAQRPVSPIVYDQYFDTDLVALIYWNGSAWKVVNSTKGGTTIARPTAPATYELYWDTDLVKLITWNGSAWKVVVEDEAGGTTAARPIAPKTYSQYWDTTLGKLTIYDGAAWKLADGTPA